MPTVLWRRTVPAINSTDKGKVKELHHNHYENLNEEMAKSNFSFRDYKQRRQMISEEKVAIKGCIAFFKTYAQSDKVSISEKAPNKLLSKHPYTKIDFILSPITYHLSPITKAVEFREGGEK